MADVLSTIGEGFKQSFLMAYQVWWALVLGFAISAIVQAWVPSERIQASLSGRGPKPVALATGLGAASSSCSYAAISIARSLIAKGASATTALAFQFASTNLVWELGLILWVLIGWQFALAEYVGGVVLIVLMAAAAALLRLAAAGRAGPGARPGGAGRAHARLPRAWRRRGRRQMDGGRAGLPRRLDDALEGDHDRLPARRLHRPARQRLLQLPLHHRRARRRSARSRTCWSGR